MGEIFSTATRKLTCFCEFFINVDGCRLGQCENHGYIKGVRKNIEGGGGGMG